MGTIDVKLDGVLKTFEVKKKLLGLSVEKQVEFLNKLYDGILDFTLYNSGSVGIDLVDKSIRILELPDCDNIDADCVNVYNCKELITLKFPKSLSKIDINRFRGRLKNIWIWDTTEIDLSRSCWDTSSINLFIQHVDNSKTEAYMNM